MKRTVTTCLLAATCITACSSGDTATEADYDDVAQALTAVVVTDNGGGEVGAMVDTAQLARGAGSLTFKLDASGAYTGSHLGLNYQYDVTCSRASGSEQQACDDSSESAAVKVSWSGDLVLPNLTADVTREGNWQLSGLQSEQIGFSGGGNFELNAELQSLFRSLTRTYHLSYEATYQDVMLQRTTRKITGGSVTFAIDAERSASGPRRESEAQFTMDGLLEFEGDGSATLTLDHSYSYKLDLATAALTKQ